MTIRTLTIALFTALLTLGLVACQTAQLPEGWEDAVPADEFESEEIEATDPEDPDLDAVHISGNLDRLEASYRGSFPCTEQLEGFQQVDGTDVDLLVQPEDLHPDAVAGSDCTFDIDFVLTDLDEGTYHVRVYRRDSDQVDPDMEAVLVGEGDALLGFAE